MTFQFQGNNYANEHEMRRRFHHQLFSCRSDFEETRRMSSFFKNPTTHGLSFTKVTSRHVFILKIIVYYYDKIASEGEGRKPSSDRQKYIVESEFALLGILSKTMSNNIFLFRFQWTTRMQAEIINV